MVHISLITNFSSVTCAHGYGQQYTVTLEKPRPIFWQKTTSPARYPIKYGNFSELPNTQNMVGKMPLISKWPNYNRADDRFTKSLCCPVERIRHALPTQSVIIHETNQCDENLPVNSLQHCAHQSYVAVPLVWIPQYKRVNLLTIVNICRNVTYT